MLKIIFGALCLIAAFCGSSSSTNIECEYGISRYFVLGDIYRCNVNSNPNIISEESAQISGVSGTHVNSSYSNDDVHGIYADWKIIEVFPTGLDKIFKNIKMISIIRCQLKEIHQSDLKAFPHLVYFNLYDNKIEIIEEGLFDYNPNLEFVGFDERNIIHIDPNVFDHLNKLRYFWFYRVPCVAKSIDDSKEKVQSAIKVVKSNCTNADFLSLDTQLKNLESESKTLDSVAFSAKLESFEKSFQNSKFFKFRPLSYKVQNLKAAFNSAQIQKTQILDKLEDLKSPQCGPVDDLKVSMDTFQFTMSESISKLGKEISSISPKVTEIQKYQNTVSKELTLNSGLKNIIGKLEDVKSSQCGLKSPFIDLKSSQDSIQTSLNSLKLTTDDQGSKLDHIQKYQNQLISLHAPQSTSINNIVAKLNEYDKTQKNHGAVLSDIKSLQNDTNAVIRELKLSHDSTRTFQDFSLINITSKLNDLNKNIKSSQDDIKLSNSEIVAILSDHTMVHIEAKNSFTKIQTVQNEIKKSLNDLSAKVNNELTDKFTSLTDKFTSLSDKVESLEGIEPHFIEFEGKIDDKLVRIEKELSNKLHRMSLSFDEKFKGIETRLVKKIEKILEEKLANVLQFF